MIGAFHRLQKLFDLVIAQARRKPKRPGLHAERSSPCGPRSHQAKAQVMIDRSFPGIKAGASHLLSQELGDVFIKRKSGSHIIIACIPAS